MTFLKVWLRWGLVVEDFGVVVFDDAGVFGGEVAGFFEEELDAGNTVEFFAGEAGGGLVEAAFVAGGVGGEPAGFLEGGGEHGIGVFRPLAGWWWWGKIGA